MITFIDKDQHFVEPETVHQMLITNAQECGVPLDFAETSWQEILAGGDAEILFDLFEISTIDLLKT